MSKAKFIFCLNKGEPSSKQINILNISIENSTVKER